MKITVYELMGLVKDGKAPKTIKYEENIYKYLNRKHLYGYYAGEGLLYDLFDDKNVFRILNDEIEIIEEKETKPSEEEIEAFKEQFNAVWNSIKSVLGGILEALIKIDEQEVVKKVLEKETNNIEKLNTYNKYTSHNNLHTYMKATDKDGKEKTFYISEVQKEIINKLNELIDVINELRGKDES